ncbi:unnamed protein product, partial [Mesorhabditis belari]|uniref:Uncharacterized protein n=1 Tax=Mesorhabditis belari TaxID=2138241 RepID=A0AAF3F068_9BILA
MQISSRQTISSADQLLLYFESEQRKPLTSFDNDAPPPVYQKETVQKRQRGKQEEPWKISAFMIIGSLLLSVTYLMNLIDWLSQAVSCYGSNLSIILTMIGISFGFHFAEAIVLSVSTFYTHRIANQSKNIFSNIILVISTISFLYSLFSSIILLLVMYLMMDEACLFTGKDVSL